MYIYANEFWNMRANTIDRAAYKRKQKILKMKRKNEELRQKERRAIEKKKITLMKKNIKEKERQKRKNKLYNFRIESRKIKNRKMNKKNMKNKKIKKAKTITNTRLTEPKNRMLLRRIMLQSQYLRGDFDLIEENYKYITKEEMLLYKNSRDKEDRIYYKEVQAYEDAKDDVTVRRGWTAFKLGLAATMLTLSINVLKDTIQDIQSIYPHQEVEISLESATQEQKDAAIIDIGLLETSCGYKFEHLTQNELIQAMLSIPAIEAHMGENEFEGAIINLKDQELLDEIASEAFGGEYNTYSNEKKFDLKKLAYELLDEKQKEYSRDPQRLKEIKEENETKAVLQEENNRKSNTNEEYDR